MLLEREGPVLLNMAEATLVVFVAAVSMIIERKFSWSISFAAVVCMFLVAYAVRLASPKSLLTFAGLAVVMNGAFAFYATGAESLFEKGANPMSLFLWVVISCSVLVVIAMIVNSTWRAEVFASWHIIFSDFNLLMIMVAVPALTLLNAWVAYQLIARHGAVFTSMIEAGDVGVVALVYWGIYGGELSWRVVGCGVGVLIIALIVAWWQWREKE